MTRRDDAGQAYLYGPTARCSVRSERHVAQDIHPARRRWRQFRHSVAGTQNTALIGAPGAYLGTTDAGAAYLFDADPASPTFGRTIGAVQEPTPTSGDLFGTAVGFDTGALIVGAAGRGGHTGARPSIFISRAHRQRVFRHDLRHGRADDSVIVSGTFMDANTERRPDGNDQLGRWLDADDRRPAGPGRTRLSPRTTT